MKKTGETAVFPVWYLHTVFLPGNKICNDIAVSGVHYRAGFQYLFQQCNNAIFV